MFHIIEPHTIDLGTLDEIRDPNFVNRYPPLYKRQPHLISLIRRRNSSLDSNHIDDILNPQFDTFPPTKSFSPISPLLHTAAESFEDSRSVKNHSVIPIKKRHIIKNLFKKFTVKRVKSVTVKPVIKHLTSDSNHSALISNTQLSSTSEVKSFDPNLSIISESSSHYLDTLYPALSKISVEIKKDSPTTILTTRSRLEMGSTACKVTGQRSISPSSITNDIIQAPTSLPSPLNSIVIPPIHQEFQTSNDPLHYTNTIVHPNLNRSELDGIGTNYNSELRRRIIEPSEIPFSHYDFYNLNSGGLSPIEEGINNIDSELSSSDYDDNESYYSFTKSPNEYTKLDPNPKSSVLVLLPTSPISKSKPRSNVIRRR